MTHLLNLAGVSDALALQLGSASYLIAIAAGALLAPRLVKSGAPHSLLVLLPVAFAPLGGSFVHLQQMAFVIPALLVLLGSIAAGDAWLGSALLLLALPFGNFTFLFLVAPFALATTVVLAREQLRLSRLATSALCAAALAAIFALASSLVPRPDAHAAVAAVAGSGLLAEATWSALIRSSYHSNVALFTLSKLPTYAALGIFAIVTLRLALRGRDGAGLVEPDSPTVRTLTSGLFLALFCLPVAAAAGQIVTNVPQSGVQVIIGGPDPTPRPVAKHAKKKPASAQSASAEGANYREPLEAAGDEAYGLGAVVVRNALRYVGVPYVWGGASPAGFDCSGFTWYVYHLAGISIPRTADVQFAQGRPIDGDPIPGDLVFFQTYDYGASHVGIYLGNGQFVNSIGGDVHIASFNSYYFRSRYLGARRFLPDY